MSDVAKKNPFLQRLFFPFAFSALVIAIFAGINRFGWDFPLSGMAGDHGGIMVGSFLGTLILLERAVVHPSRFALLGPFINLLSLPFFLLGLPQIATGLLIAGGGAMVLIFYLLSLRSPSLEQYVLVVAAIFYTCGNLVLLLTGLYPKVFPFWFSFFLFMITGERLELSRFLNISPTKHYTLVALLLLAGLGAFFPFHGAGKYLMVAGLAGTAIWLLKYDMAGKSVKKSGQFRFTGIALIFGYCWLLVSAIILFFWQSFPFGYDAALHTFFIGFVFNMIFAHAPIILPAVTKIRGLPFHQSLYIWLGLLQIGLIIRVLADAGLTDLRVLSGFLNGIAILGYFINQGIVFATVKK